MAKKFFDDATLTKLRELQLTTALDIIGLRWKVDSTFQPGKNSLTQRLYVDSGSHNFEILLTGVKWYDPRADQGGGGAIDLTMHILKVNFVDAVKRLTR